MRQRSLIPVALLVLALCSSFAAGAEEEKKKRTRPKAQITPLEVSFEQERLSFAVDRDGLGAVHIQPDSGCEKDCNAKSLAIGKDVTLLINGRRAPLARLRDVEGKPGTVFVKIGTDQVLRIAAYSY